MLTDPKTEQPPVKTTGIEEVKLRTTGIEEYKTPVTGIVEVKAPTTGIEEFVEPTVKPTQIPDVRTPTPTKPPAEMPKGAVSFMLDKEFRVGQKIWHPLWHETGTVSAEENFRGDLLLVENGKPSESYGTKDHAKTTLFLTVEFEKMGKRRLACNIERLR